MIFTEYEIQSYYDKRNTQNLSHVYRERILKVHLSFFQELYEETEGENQGDTQTEIESFSYVFFLLPEDDHHYQEEQKVGQCFVELCRMTGLHVHLFEYIDFTSFSKLHTDVKTNICHISHAEWTKMEGEDTTWVFTIRADRFLRNMVRAIVGTLLEVGRGKLTVEGFRKVIEQQDRCKAGTSAPGNALFLVNVEYPEDIFSEETKKSVLSTLLPEGGEC